MTRRFFQLALALGLITAVGPFAIDMYLPALPSIGASLQADPAMVQMSLLVFFITIGVCQLFYGPISDMFGRKPPLVAALVLFIAASIACALAPNVETLIVARVFQAMGACCGMVVPRAIVRDLHTGHEATQLMSMLMLVMSVSPILAPLVGSGVIALVGWRGVFWAVSIAGLVGLVLTTRLTETRGAGARVGSSWVSAFSAYGLLLKDWRFLGLVFAGGFGMAEFFVYLANSSFVLIDHFGLTPSTYGIYFGVNAAAFFAAAQLTGPLSKRYGLRPVVRWAVTGCALTLIATALITRFGPDDLNVLAACIFVGNGFLGLVIPITGVLALERHGPIAGTASALMGSLQMATGAAAMAVSTVFADTTPLPMVLGMTVCGVMCFLVVQVTLARPLPAPDHP